MPRPSSTTRKRKRIAQKMNEIVRKRKTFGCDTEACTSSLQPNENEFRHTKTDLGLASDNSLSLTSQLINESDNRVKVHLTADELPMQPMDVCQESNDERKRKTSGCDTETFTSSLSSLQPNENYFTHTKTDLGLASDHSLSPTSQLINESDNRVKVHLTADELPVQPMEVCQESNDELIAIRARVNDLTQQNEEELNETANTDDEELHISYEKDIETPEKSVGRRVIAVSHFFGKLQEISNHGPLGCNINNLKLIAETQNGLQSKFTFKCSLCNIKFIIDGDNCADDFLPVNKCAVAGTVAIGCGYSQLEELLSSINLPVVSEKTYNKIHDFISNKWEDVLLESMNEAAEEERKLAKEENRLNKDGIPIIDVIVDGCWSKRSYKKNYNAPSGAGAIIGKMTGKILFLGIKNKYCCICAHAQKNKVETREHRCFKNYTGPSTNMESEILVEGFKESMKQHNLIYGRLISDGDSSTYSKILQARPYTDVTVEKVECRNHVLRNLCNKLQALITDTKYCSQLRKLVTKKRILTIRAVIVKAIKKHKTGSDVQLLFEDILQSHRHAFGNHTKCHSHFCNKIGTNEDTPSNFYYSALWQKICLIVQNVASHARSLIHDVDSNAVERYHSIVAKFVGGKRINFAKKNSYRTRCQAAAVSYNEKKSISRLYKSINKGASPRGKLSVLERRRINKNKRNVKLYKPKNRSLFVTEKKRDNNYGQDCLKPDMPLETFESIKEKFLENLKRTDEERQEIEQKTILQGDSSEWLELRRTLLTASNFGKVIKRRSDSSCQNFVRDLLYKISIDHVPSIRHGKDNEKLAIKQLEAQEGIRVEPCGLFIDANLPFLGATPDGICGHDTIVEIKCPITANKMGIDESIKKKKVTFWQQKKTGMEINKNHQWYYQIQGQLHVTKRSKCIFAVWSNENTPLKTELVIRDDQFWFNEMENKLKSFYLDCILPELIDPRHPRGLPIRNPKYIEEALKKKAEKSKGKENIKPVTDKTKKTVVEQNLEELEVERGIKGREVEQCLEEQEVERCMDEEDDLANISTQPTCSKFLDFNYF